MSNPSAIEYWEKYSSHAFDNTDSAVYSSCILLSPTKRVVPCTFCFTIKRDIFDLPSVIVGNVSKSIGQAWIKLTHTPCMLSSSLSWASHLHILDNHRRTFFLDSLRWMPLLIVNYIYPSWLTYHHPHYVLLLWLLTIINHAILI
jgi:hypothetical protein